jgi:predicted dehydrogenase
VRVAIIGAGVRCRTLYLPAVLALPQVDSIGIWSRGSIEITAVPGHGKLFHYLSLEEVLSDKSVDLLIACVAWTANAGL